MKTTLFLFSLCVSISAFSQTIKFEGLKARAFIEIGARTDALEGSMGGKADMDLTDVKCEKTVDAAKTIYLQKCTFLYFGKNSTITSDDAKNSYVAEDLRMALREILGNETKVDDTKKVIAAKEIKCHSAGFGHTLDALETEQSFHCEVTE